MIFSLCFGLFLLSILSCASVSLNIYFAMPPSLVSCLRLVFDLFFALIEILMKMVYIFLLFVCNIFGYVLKMVYDVCPYIYNISSALFSLFIWIITQVFRGLLGMGDKATNALSWMFLFSAIYLYLDNRYWEKNRTEQNPEVDAQILPGHQEQNERNVIIHDEEHNSDDSDSHHSNDERSDLSDSGGEENEQIDIENRENENEANVQQEAAHLRIRNDNERNTNAERNRLPNAQQELERQTLCSICFERERNVAVFPCGHIHMCLECVQNVQKGNKLCPMCQRQIEEYRQVFF